MLVIAYLPTEVGWQKLGLRYAALGIRTAELPLSTQPPPNTLPLPIYTQTHTHTHGALHYGKREYIALKCNLTPN